MARNLNTKDTLILYSLSAGRCNICNNLLVEHHLTGNKGNYGQRAHIHDHSPNAGVRPIPDDFAIDRVIDSNYPASLDNILLLCHPCHWNADKEAPEDWSIESLKEYKRSHERRIRLQTEANKRTYCIEFYSNIGDFNPRSSLEMIRDALRENQRFIQENIILGDQNRTYKDSDEAFWQLEDDTLCKQYRRGVEEAKEENTFEHISVFALASQPLLIRLGHLLGSHDGVDVYPKHRDVNKAWGWDRDSKNLDFRVHNEGDGNVPVIVLQISGSASTSISDLQGYLDEGNLDVYVISIDEIEVAKKWNRSANDSFRKASIDVINRVHEKYGLIPIHVFPALPNHLAVEFGRAKLPKAHPKLIIHDFNKKNGCWMKALEIE